MSQPRLEVAEVLRSCRDEYWRTHSASLQQRRAFEDIAACRTAALGGHLKQCQQCGHQLICYNSCRNRHCPKCQAGQSARWLQARAADLLPVPYFHVVFTLPAPLGPLALQNKRTVYAILFQAAAQTLLAIAADPKHLGARIGFIAVLHTWGQRLDHHPHLHCVVPGGGICADESRWVASRPNFFLPVRVLSRLFRSKFLRALRKARRKGKLDFYGQLQPLSRPGPWSQFVRKLQRCEWVVYSKPPFAGPLQVLKYLARYTHRVAISNRRLLALRQGKVTFRYKDYKRGRHSRAMTLDASEFIRRFLLHILPKGFMRIRHYGFLANCCRKKKLALCSRLLGQGQTPAPPEAQLADRDPLQPELCPVCRQGCLAVVETLPPAAKRTEPRMNSPGR